MTSLWKRLVGRLSISTDSDQYYLNVKETVVQIRVGQSRGTGFYIGPTCILTTAHTFEENYSTGITSDVSRIEVKHKNNTLEIDLLEIIQNISKHKTPYPDLALLKTKTSSDYFLSIEEGELPLGKEYYTFGFSKSVSGGDSDMLDYVGPSYIDPEQTMELRKFTNSLILAGVSGSPVVLVRTGNVVALIQSSRDFEQPLGGKGVPVDAATSFENSCIRGPKSGYDIVQESFRKMRERRAKIIEDFLGNEPILSRLRKTMSKRFRYDETLSFYLRTVVSSGISEVVDQANSPLINDLRSITDSIELKNSGRTVVIRVKKNEESIGKLVDLGLSGRLASLGVVGINSFYISRAMIVDFIGIVFIGLIIGTTFLSSPDATPVQEKLIVAPEPRNLDSSWYYEKLPVDLDIDFANININSKKNVLFIDGGQYPVPRKIKRDLSRLVAERRSLIGSLYLALQNTSRWPAQHKSKKIKYRGDISWGSPQQLSYVQRLVEKLVINHEKIALLFETNQPNSPKSS